MPVSKGLTVDVWMPDTATPARAARRSLTTRRPPFTGSNPVNLIHGGKWRIRFDDHRPNDSATRHRQARIRFLRRLTPARFCWSAAPAGCAEHILIAPRHLRARHALHPHPVRNEELGYRCCSNVPLGVSAALAGVQSRSPLAPASRLGSLGSAPISPASAGSAVHRRPSLSVRNEFIEHFVRKSLKPDLQRHPIRCGVIGLVDAALGKCASEVCLVIFARSSDSSVV